MDEPTLAALPFTVVSLTILANAGMAMADFCSAEFVLKSSVQVGVSTVWTPVLGALKSAGAVGLFIGIVGVYPISQPIGVVAALCLVVYFLGATAVHVRARAFRSIAWPVTYLGLAIASLVALL